MNAQFLRYSYKLIGKRRSPKANKSLGMVLAFIAGFINAGGFFVVQQYTSHMTGIISIAADEIALGGYFSAMLMLGYIMCFVAGACLTTIIVIRAREHSLYSRYALPLVFEAAFLLFIVLLYSSFSSVSFIVPLVIALLCFLMGLQNALITKVSTSIIRTTHVTGMATDLGIEIGRAMLSKESISFNKNKILVHLYIISMFFIGGVIGALTINNIGVYGLLPAAIMLFAFSVPLLLKDASIYIKLKARKKKYAHIFKG